MLTVDFADVLCQIPAIGIPCAVLLDGKRTSSYRLRRIPGDKPQAWMVTASEVAASNLEVASVQESLVQRYITIDGHLLGCSSAHVVVRAFHNGATICIGKRSRAVLSIVDYRPDTGGGFHRCSATDCRIEGNKAVNSGGGGYTMFSLVGCDVIGNQTENGPGAGGYEINYATNCLFADNRSLSTSNQGGGISNNSNSRSNSVICDSVISNNYAAYNSGGVSPNAAKIAVSIFEIVLSKQ